MATHGKYQCLTLKRKLQIIDEVEQSPRKKKKDIASEFSIPQSTLSTILKGSCMLPMSLAGLNEGIAENLLDLNPIPVVYSHKGAVCSDQR